MTTTITEKTKVSIEIGKIWAVIITGIMICCTVLGVYYNFRNSFNLLQQRTELELKVINMRLDKLESK